MATTTLDEETAKKVVRQVEFYFSDSNLPKDEFLMKSINESADGMVSLALICSFSRMRSHLGLGNLKADEIPGDTVKAVAESLSSSDIVKISDDGAKIGRKFELAKPEELIMLIDNRTLAASPLPYDVKLEDVESFFNQLAKVNSVRLPSHVSNKKLFCGTALIEFSSEENMQKVMAQTVVYAGADLEFKPKKDFDAEREALIAKYGNSHDGSIKNSTESSYPKGLLVSFTLKRKSFDSHGAPEECSDGDASKKEEQEGNTPVEQAESKTDISDDIKSESETNEGKDDNKPSEDANVKQMKATTGEKFNFDATKSNMNVVLREDLKAACQKFGAVMYVDFSAGDESGYIRFKEAEAAQKARAAAVLSEEGGLSVKNFIATLEPVTGEVEKEYWVKIGERSRDNRGNKGRGGKPHRGGWKQGRSRDNDSRGRPNKIQKISV